MKIIFVATCKSSVDISASVSSKWCWFCFWFCSRQRFHHKLIAWFCLLITLVFLVQWKCITKNVRAVLRGSQLRVFTLEGNGSQRARTLEQFAEGGVLLLSLEDSFAGLHLPHARHVVFTHAIVGSPERVRAVEYQAISRCLRHGQTGSVFVHSIVVSELAEEDMWRVAHDDIPYTVSGAFE